MILLLHFRTIPLRSPRNLIHHPPKHLLPLTLLQENLILHPQQLLHAFRRRRPHDLPRLAHPVHDAPQILGLAIVSRIRARGFGAQHRGAVADRRMHVARDQDGHVARGRDERHQDVVLALGAGHEDGADFVAGLVHGGDDLVRLEGNELHRAQVVEAEAVEALVAAEADYRAGHGRVRDGGAVPEQVAVEEEVAAQVGDGGCVVAGLHVAQVLVQVVVDVGVVLLRHAEGVLVRGVGFEDVLEELARRGLAAFGHPVVWDDAVAVGAPDAVDEDGLGRHDEVAG